MIGRYRIANTEAGQIELLILRRVRLVQGLTTVRNARNYSMIKKVSMNKEMQWRNGGEGKVMEGTEMVGARIQQKKTGSGSWNKMPSG